MASNSEAVLKRLANEALLIRRNVWRAFHAAGSGHIGGSSSAADLLAALYLHICQPRDPFQFAKRDPPRVSREPRPGKPSFRR